MASAPQHSASRRCGASSLVLILLCLLSTACNTASQNAKILFEDQRGAVLLQRIPDESIHATHPLKMDPTLLTQLLKGIAVQDQERGLQRILAGPSAPVPVFSDDEIQFLAPLLSEGLRTASPNQRVEFRVVTTYEGSNRFQSPTRETTSGSLYAYGRQLYVILSQFRVNPTLTNLDMNEAAHRSQQPLDYSGLKYRTLLFTQKAAQRADSPDPPAEGKPTDKFLAVDYQLLQQAWQNLEAKKRAAPVEGGTASVSESLEAARAAEIRASVAEAQARAAEAQARNTEALAQEVETLKKQLESIQKQLGSQKPKP